MIHELIYIPESWFRSIRMASALFHWQLTVLKFQTPLPLKTSRLCGHRVHHCAGFAMGLGFIDKVWQWKQTVNTDPHFWYSYCKRRCQIWGRSSDSWSSTPARQVSCAWCTSLLPVRFLIETDIGTDPLNSHRTLLELMHFGLPRPSSSARHGWTHLLFQFQLDRLTLSGHMSKSAPQKNQFSISFTLTFLISIATFTIGI
jgi:hypothetical protein